MFKQKKKGNSVSIFDSNSIDITFSIVFVFQCPCSTLSGLVIMLAMLVVIRMAPAILSNYLTFLTLLDFIHNMYI